jgi:hypothetical protein
VEAARAYSRQGRLADGYQALRIAETCAAQDVRRPAVRELVADMAARDRRRTLPDPDQIRVVTGVTAHARRAADQWQSPSGTVTAPRQTFARPLRSSPT